MENNNELKIITDETLMEKRNHGQPAFPFQYYLEDIWDFDFHTLGWHWHQEIEFVYVQSGEAHCCVGKDRFSLPAGSGLFINTKMLNHCLFPTFPIWFLSRFLYGIRRYFHC